MIDLDLDDGDPKREKMRSHLSKTPRPENFWRIKSSLMQQVICLYPKTKCNNQVRKWLLYNKGI